MQDNDQQRRTCQVCGGKGKVLDTRVAGITHKRTAVKRNCRNCDNGVLRPRPSTVDDGEGAPEGLAWMLEWMNVRLR
jgi:hypothetical protein